MFSVLQDVIHDGAHPGIQEIGNVLQDAKPTQLQYLRLCQSKSCQYASKNRSAQVQAPEHLRDQAAPAISEPFHVPTLTDSLPKAQTCQNKHCELTTSPAWQGNPAVTPSMRPRPANVAAVSVLTSSKMGAVPMWPSSIRAAKTRRQKPLASTWARRTVTIKTLREADRLA